MKRKVVIFLSAVLLSLLIVPAINILDAPSRDVIKWRERLFLFNMDFLSRWEARLLYPLGISTNPKQVIIGRDSWLYLGYMYKQKKTVDQNPPTEADFALGKKIGAAAEAWDAFLATKGVKLFRIMIGPEKDSIYPENLPEWAKTTRPNATDALIAGTGAVRYVDLRKPLLDAKPNQPTSLYYKTDTHWNSLGAGIAFRAFAQQVSLAAPELRWPSEKTYELSHIEPRGGGDLANFLRLNADLVDFNPIIHGSSVLIETTQFDFETKKIIHQGGNPPIGSPSKPILIKSYDALNKKRVLWLRDSFGTAMSPLMASTFTEILQLHYDEGLKSPERFIQLIDEFKPEYIFFTVVERSSRADIFTVHPPSVLIPKIGYLSPIQKTVPKEKN